LLGPAVKPPVGLPVKSAHSVAQPETKLLTKVSGIPSPFTSARMPVALAPSDSVTEWKLTVPVPPCQVKVVAGKQLVVEESHNVTEVSRLCVVVVPAR